MSGKTGRKRHPVEYSMSPERVLVDPVDVHAAMKKRDARLEAGGTKLTASASVRGMERAPVDIEWLHSAAAAYNVSPSIKDYLMVPVILFYADIPNKNGFGFSLGNLTSWSSEHGTPRYQTWRGKPVFVDHANTDVKQARGLVLDTFIKKVPAKDKTIAGPAGDYWKLLAYLAVDRGKDKQLAMDIMAKDVTTYSMGTIVSGGYLCSVSGKKVGASPYGLDMKKPRYGMKLVETGKDRQELA